jgi:sulfoxide reductase catalytic subunit YedY
MLVRRADDIASSEITPSALYLRRREFLQAAGILASAGVASVLPGTAAAGTLGGRAALQTGAGAQKLATTGRMVTTSDPLTSYKSVTTYNNFYEFGSSKEDPSRNSGKFKPRPWSVVVDGECAKPGTYGLEDILKPHPLEERVYRMRCVEEWSMIIPWVGFPLGALLKRFQPNGNAAFVEFTTVLRPDEMPEQRPRLTQLLPWPYKEGLRMDEAMHTLTILAVGLYGETLLNQNGAPLRLVVPWKYGFKGIKSIVKISFVRKQPRTTWQSEWPEAYGFYSNVNPTRPGPRYQQASEIRIGEPFRRRTLMFNGYAEQVESLYKGMNLQLLY